MKKSWRLIILVLLIACSFASGCAKKTLLKEEIMPKTSAATGAATPLAKAKASEKSKDQEDAKKHSEQERTAREGVEKEQAEKLEAARKMAALPAKELYEFADIKYDFNDFHLKGEARTILNKHSEWLNKNNDIKITIEGHCDERGTAEYNLALGERRAEAAADFLIDLGIDGKRIKTISYGHERPFDPRHNEEAWAKNRRAHFDVPKK